MKKALMVGLGTVMLFAPFSFLNAQTDVSDLVTFTSFSSAGNDSWTVNFPDASSYITFNNNIVITPKQYPYPYSDPYGPCTGYADCARYSSPIGSGTAWGPVGFSSTWNSAGSDSGEYTLWFVKDNGTVEAYVNFAYVQDTEAIIDEPPPEWWQFATTTRVYNVSPTPGVVYPIQNVEFEFEIFLNALQNPPPVFAGYEVQNTTRGITYNTSQGEQEVVTSGFSVFESDPDPQFPIGDAYIWRPYIRDANGVRVYGYWSSFSVVEQNASSSPFTPFPDDLTATSTGEFGFVSTIVDMVASKPPFLWFIQINNAIQNASYSEGETPTLTASSTLFAPVLGGAQSITLLDEEIFDEFIPENVHTGFMTLQLIVFYLMGGMYVMRRTLSFFQPQQ